jgi:hypothetical protein
MKHIQNIHTKHSFILSAVFVTSSSSSLPANSAACLTKSKADSTPARDPPFILKDSHRYNAGPCSALVDRFGNILQYTTDIRITGIGKCRRFGLEKRHIHRIKPGVVVNTDVDTTAWVVT